jgi:hypothetical protein
MRNHHTKFRALVIFALIAFTPTAFSYAFAAGRIIPKGKVTLHHNSRKIGEFTTEAPLPEGMLLSVEGECGIKMKALYLVALDKSQFSIKTNPTTRELTVENGTVYFALSSMPQNLMFLTPNGVITTHGVMVHASADAGSLRGYISVEEGVTRLGVLSGGAMIISVGDGDAMSVKAGKEIRLAQVELFEEKEEKKEQEEPKAVIEPKPEPEVTTEEGVSIPKIAIGALTLGALAALGMGGGGGGGGGSPPTSPSE